MRIGFDFDNTIACYDGVFHAAAVRRGLIPAQSPTDKNSVRDYLRAQGRDADFTALQGYVYGPGMSLVSPYPGLVAGLARARGLGHRLFVVSHKTQVPFVGERHDLHAFAREALLRWGLVGPHAPFAEADVYFELTKEAKVARIQALGCDVFVDDLPEILDMPGFPVAARGLLFDPDNHFVGQEGRERFAAWDDIFAALLAEPARGV